MDHLQGPPPPQSQSTSNGEAYATMWTVVVDGIPLVARMRSRAESRWLG